MARPLEGNPEKGLRRGAQLGVLGSPPRGYALISAPALGRVAESVKFPIGELAQRLKKVTIFGGLSPQQLRSLAKWADVFSFDPGERVVKKGAKDNGLYLILDGSAEVKHGSKTLARLSAGQFFGELSLFDDLPRSADVVASKPSRMAVLQKWEFWGYAASQPGVVLRILEEMSRRLRAANRALAD